MANENECKHELVNILRYGCYVTGWGATAWFGHCVECNQIVHFPMVGAPNTACSGLAECLANFYDPPDECTPADGISWDTANHQRKPLAGERQIMLFWNAPISKASRILDIVKGHELFFYGVTIGWLGIGFVVGRERQLTKRALDGAKVCPDCGGKRGVHSVFCSVVSGISPRR